MAEKFSWNILRKCNVAIHSMSIISLACLIFGSCVEIARSLATNSMELISSWSYWIYVFAVGSIYIIRACVFPMRMKHTSNPYDKISSYIGLIIEANIFTHFFIAKICFLFIFGGGLQLIGQVENLGALLSFCSIIAAIVGISEIRRYDADERNAKKELINSQKVAIKNRKQAINILSKIGCKFFISNYEILKNWSVPDIFDSITENYSEETKLEKIKNAKKLFHNGLEQHALIYIADSEKGSIDEKTIAKAQELLQVMQTVAYDKKAVVEPIIIASREEQEQMLAELEDVYHEGVISRQQYEERKKSILPNK